MQHDEQVRSELQARYDTLTAHIRALDDDLGRTMDGEQKLILQTRRNDLANERQRIAQQLITDKTNNEDPRIEADDMEREDLKLVNDLRIEVALLRKDMDDLKSFVALLHQEYGLAGSTLSPMLLNIMVIGGVMIMALLIFLTVRLV